MPDGTADIPDWRVPEAYDVLRHAERAGFAWEWLRRDPQYRNAAFSALAAGTVCEQIALAPPWHLHAIEDPRLPVPLARPVWTASVYPWVVRGYAKLPKPGEEVLDVRRLGDHRLIRCGNAQRLLLSNGTSSIRLDLAGTVNADAPIRIAFTLVGISSLDRPLLVLRRLRSLAMTGVYAPSLYPPLINARRLILMLRTFDALCAGASQAEIAAHLLGPLDRRLWRVHSPSRRSQAQRLVRTARELAAGGYWKFLQQ